MRKIYFALSSLYYFAYPWWFIVGCKIKINKYENKLKSCRENGAISKLTIGGIDTRSRQLPWPLGAIDIWRQRGAVHRARRSGISCWSKTRDRFNNDIKYLEHHSIFRLVDWRSFSYSRTIVTNCFRLWIGFLGFLREILNRNHWWRWLE